MLPYLLRLALPCALTAFSVGASAAPAAKVAAKKTAVKKSAPAKSAARTLRRAGSQWFLSHAEFSALTRSEQKNYLKEIKKVLA
nr:hypothetical protein [Pseudobdellovibrionaceae bacterium]